MDAKLWSDMFKLGLPVLEKVLRPVIVYFFLIIGLRIAGKRELAQLNPFDLVVLLTISNTVQNAIIGEDNSVTGGMIGAATLLLVNYMVVRFVYGHQKLEHLVEGDADLLMQAGKINMPNLKKNLITLPELEMVARRQGFASLDEVDRAVLEPSGTISFIGHKPTAEEERHGSILDRLDKISAELAALRAALPPLQHSKT